MEEVDYFRKTIHHSLLQEALKAEVEKLFFNERHSNQVTYYLLHDSEKRVLIVQAERLISSIQHHLAIGNLKHGLYLIVALKHLNGKIINHHK